MRVQARRRVTFVAALAVMVGASRWLLLTASVPQVAAGTWASAGGFGPVPDGAAAATLADGRMVIAGGRYDSGALVSQIGIYDPASGSWQDGGQLVMARTNHTATALTDGRVVFAGGYTANGVSSDVEVYNPGTGQSVHAGDMWSPRVNHAATELGAGMVFYAGGSDGSAALDHLELFDVDAGTTRSLSVRMSVARENLTATRLLDGHILLAGGRNSSGDLTLAEIFQSGNGALFATGPLHAARSGHVAVLLPNNNQVLIAGGYVDGAPAASAELYADWRDGFTIVPNAMSQARTNVFGAALPLHDVAFVGGGGSGEFFGYATVKTDRADYWPGETVTITGSGWQPGETVALKISEDSDTHNDFTFTAVANAQGQIENKEFAPIDNEVFHHFGMRFYLTATGAASTALNTFTDGSANVTGVVTSAGGSPISGATVTCTNGCNNSATTTTGTNGSYLLSVQYPGNTASIEVTASAAGYAAKTEIVAVSNSAGGTKNFSLDPAITVTVATSGSPSTYGDSVTFTATVSSSATGSVQFKNGATNLGAPVTVSGGQATLVTSTLLAGSHSITAVFTGTPANSTSAALIQVVDPKALTITAANQSKVYGNVMTPAGTEFTASGLVGTDAVTSVTLSSAGYEQTATVTGSPYTVTPSAAVGSGLSNYTIAYSAGTLTVTARPVTVTADTKTKTYGATEPDLTYQLTTGSLVGSDSFSGTLTRVSGENVGSYAIEQGTLTLGTNYAITFVSANLSITPATLSVTAQPQTKEYGAADPPLTYLADGFKFSDTAASVLTGALARLPGENVAGSPYAIGQGSLAANSNYTLAFTPSALSITPATLAVTAAAKTKEYGEGDPALTYQANGFKFSDTAATVLTGVLQRAAGEGVAGSPYTISQGSLAANSNYTIAFTGASLTITPATLTVTAEAKSKEYGEADPALTYLSSGYKFSDNAASVLSGSLERAAGETVLGGPYAIGQGSLVANANYAIGFTGAALTINPKGASVSPAAASKEYGADDPAFTGSLVGFVAADGVTASYSRTAGETVAGGPYTISATLSPADVLSNYAITYNTAPFTITTRAASVTPDTASKQYGAADPAFTGTLSGFLAADGVTATYSRIAGETVAGSPYTISATLSPAGVLSNYTITYDTATFTITPKAASVTPAPASKEYGAVEPTLTGTLDGFLAADGVTATYSRTAGETVAGSPYTISATLSPAGVLSNYTITYNTANFTITPKAASVTPDAASKQYGAADPSLTGNVSGFLAADGVTATYSRTAGETVLGGPYTISATLSPAGVLSNYNVTYNTAAFTIDPKTASVTPAAASKEYGASDPAFTGSLVGFVAADGVTASYSRTAGETVAGGPYTISATLSPAGVLSNYNITYNTANFTIGPKAATVKADDKTKLLGEGNPTLTATVQGVIPGDVLNYSLATTATTGSNVGVYPITVTPGSNPNYNVTPVNGELSIFYRWDGFLQPINDTAHDLGAMSKFRLGSTVPAKFQIKNAAGAVVQQATNPGFRAQRISSACTGTELLETAEAMTADASPIYKWDGTQYHYGWSTRGFTAGLYQIFADLSDSTSKEVTICLTR